MKNLDHNNSYYRKLEICFTSILYTASFTSTTRGVKQAVVEVTLDLQQQLLLQCKIDCRNNELDAGSYSYAMN